MYHPNAMLKIAHDREAELVREAEACGIPKKTDGNKPWLSRRMLVMVFFATMLATTLRVFLG